MLGKEFGPGPGTWSRAGCVGRGLRLGKGSSGCWASSAQSSSQHPMWIYHSPSQEAVLDTSHSHSIKAIKQPWEADTITYSTL